MKGFDRRLVQTLDWNLLKVFATIVEAGGVARAAIRLGRQQPAVSLALQRLEQQLGCVLCLRGPAGFSLTDEGRRLAEMCVAMRESIRELPASLSEGSTVRGSLRMGVISNLVDRMLDAAIVAFHRDCPEVELQVTVTTWAEVINALLSGSIDVGVAPSRQQRAELQYLPLFREVHLPYCGAGHPLFGARSPGAGRLGQERFILTGADEPDELTGFRLRHGIGQSVAGVTEYLDEAKRLAVLGVGICFLPIGFAQPEVDAGRLWPLLSERGAPSMDIYVISRLDAPPNVARRLFLETATATVKEASRATPGDGSIDAVNPAH